MKSNYFKKLPTDLNVRAGDIISIGLKRYKLGSVASYALKDNDCPIYEIERAVKNGDKLHWANPQAVTLSATPRKPDYGTPVSYGDTIYFEGRFFELSKAPNDNIRLDEVIR